MNRLAVTTWAALAASTLMGATPEPKPDFLLVGEPQGVNQIYVTPAKPMTALDRQVADNILRDIQTSADSACKCCEDGSACTCEDCQCSPLATRQAKALPKTKVIRAAKPSPSLSTKSNGSGGKTWWYADDPSKVYEGSYPGQYAAPASTPAPTPVYQAIQTWTPTVTYAEPVQSYQAQTYAMSSYSTQSPPSYSSGSYMPSVAGSYTPSMPRGYSGGGYGYGGSSGSACAGST